MKQISLATSLIGLLISLNVSAQVVPITEVFAPTWAYPPKQFQKVAVIQWNQVTPTPVDMEKEKAEDFKQNNRVELTRYIREAAANRAKLIITPEFGTVGYPDFPGVPTEEDNFRNRKDLEPYVETADGKTFQYFSNLAKELKVYLHIGFAEVDPKDNKYYNTVLAIAPNGELAAKFRKINLFTHENDFLSAGSEPVTYTSIFGKVGIALCSDIYSTNPMEKYRELGVNVVALSTSWDVYNSGFDAFTSAARQLGGYVLAANQTYFPDSGVISPDGSAQSHIRQSTGIAYGFLPLVSLPADHH